VGAGAPAHAATDYDGSATALRVQGLSLDLFPGQAEFDDVPSVVFPDSALGDASFDSSETVAEVPANPLLTAQLLEASSTLVDGAVVSEATVTGLDVGQGVLTADIVQSTCTGDGQTITLDVPQAALASDSPELTGEIQLQPGRSVRVPGVGTVTFNVQQTDGSSSGSASNLVIELDTDLDLEQLREIPEAAEHAEEALREALADLRDSNPVAGEAVPSDAELEQLTLRQLYEVVDQVLAEPPLEQFPDADNLAHLSGTVTVATAECSQAVTEEPVATEPRRPESDVPPAARNRPGPSEPPLADTGSPAAMAGAGLTGLAALLGGGLTLLRSRRR